MTISGRILREIKYGPTASELGAILFPKMRLRDSMRRCSAHLCNLRTEGKLKVIGKVPPDGHRETERARRVMSNLYDLINPCFLIANDLQ